MRTRSIIITGAISLLAFGALVFGSGELIASAEAAPAQSVTVQHTQGPRCNTPVPSGDTRHVVDSGASLVQWADAHAYGSVGNILSATIQCGPGIQQLGFFKYLDKANLRAPLPAGTVLWVPFGGYERS